MTRHTVVQGEHLSRIALQYGFRDFRLIWNDDANADLRARRVNPHVLLPGDRLEIPDKQQKKETRPTGATHRFRLGAPRMLLRLQVLDFDNDPVKNADCELEIDGVKTTLTTDGDGRIAHEISATAEDGVLRIPSLDIELPLKIGHLDPADEDSGWRQRLSNLGYRARPDDDGDEAGLRQALEEFQCDQGLKVTGLLDAATRARLVALHGS